MQRQTLLLFIGILLTILAFSAAAGIASIFWKPSETSTTNTNKTKDGRKKDKDVEELRPVGKSDEDGDDWNRKFKNGTLTGILTSSRDGKPAEGVYVEVISLTTYTENSRSANADENDIENDEGSFRNLSSKEKQKLVSTSDSEGRYKLELPPSHGPIWLKFYSNRFHEQVQRAGFNKSATLDLELQWRPTTKVHVTDESGKAVKEYDIRAKQSRMLGISNERNNRTNSNPGEIRLSTGKWEVWVAIGSRLSKTQTVYFDDKTDISLEFTVPATNNK
ncbi:MAG: hypothetical protein ACKVS6_00905 [Planctomycetota bacterium]